MVVPLKECSYKEIDSSKPGNLKDKYFREQDINNCIEKVKQEILHNSSIFINDNEIFKIIDKWLSTHKPIIQSFDGVKLDKGLENFDM